MKPTDSLIKGTKNGMKNVQIVFNIQVPDHVSEQEVSSRLNQVIGSLMSQEFGLDNALTEHGFSDDHSGHIGNA